MKVDAEQEIKKTQLSHQAETLSKGIVRQTALSTLLHKRDGLNSSLLIALEINGIILGDGGFMLAAFQPILAEGTLEYPYLDCLVKAKAAAEAAFDGKCIYYSFFMDGFLIVLCCFPRSRKQERREAQVRDLLGRLCQQTSVLYTDATEMSLRFSISPMGYGAESICSLYLSLADAMEFAAFLGKDVYLPSDSLEIRSRGIVHKTETINATARRFANQIYTKTMLSVPNQVSLFVRSLTDGEYASIRDLHFSLLTFDRDFFRGVATA